MILDLQLASHLVARHFESTTAALSLTLAEAHVILQVARGGRQTVGDLRRASGLKPSTLTSVLDRLERRKLTRRAPNPSDRRSVLIELTHSGATRAKRLELTLEKLERELRAHVRERDLRGVEAVAAALQRIVVSA